MSPQAPGIGLMVASLGSQWGLCLKTGHLRQTRGWVRVAWGTTLRWKFCISPTLDSRFGHHQSEALYGTAYLSLGMKHSRSESIYFPLNMVWLRKSNWFSLMKAGKCMFWWWGHWLCSETSQIHSVAQSAVNLGHISEPVFASIFPSVKWDILIAVFGIG